MVVALRISDFSFAGSAATDGSGNYTTHAPPGSYFPYVLDTTAGHTDGFFGAPLNVFVSDGGNSDTAITMVPNRGSFSGTLTDQATGIPLGGVQVFAIGTTGIVASTTTDGNGTYNLANLPVGTYRAVFVDALGRRTPSTTTTAPTSPAPSPSPSPPATTPPTSTPPSSGPDAPKSFRLNPTVGARPGLASPFPTQ